MSAPRERSATVIYDLALFLLLSLGLVFQLLFGGSRNASSIFLIHVCFNLLLLLVALHLIFSRRVRRRLSWFDLLVAGFLAYAAVNCATAPVKIAAIRQAPYFIDCLAVYLLASTVLWHRFRGFALLTVMLTPVLMIAEASLDPRALSLASPVALLLVFSLPFAVYIAISHYPRPSRGVLRLAQWTFLLVCVAVTAWAAYSLWEARRDLSRYEAAKQVHYASQAAVRAFLERPVVGIGAGNLWALAKAKSLVPLETLSGYYPGYLPVLAEFGIAGAVVFFVMALGFMVEVFRREKFETSFEARLRASTIAASACGILIVIYVGEVMSAESAAVLLGLLFGMAAAKNAAPGAVNSAHTAEGEVSPDASVQTRVQRRGGGFVRYMMAVLVVVILAIVTAAETIPMLIGSLTVLRKNESLRSETYAERLFTALRLAPYDPALHLLLAAHYRARLDAERDVAALLPEIVTAYEHAIARDRYSAAGYFHLADIYKRCGKLRESVLTLERGLSYNPNSLELNIALLSGYEEHGWFGKALEHAREITLRFPEYDGCVIRLARIYASSGNTDAARAHLYRAVQKNPLSNDRGGRRETRGD